MLRRLHSAAVARASGVGHGLGTIGKVLTKFSVASEELGCHEVGGKPTQMFDAKILLKLRVKMNFYIIS